MSVDEELAPAEIPGASVPFPPPLAYVAGMALGFSLHLLFPARIVTSVPAEHVLRPLGWGVLIVSLTLAASSLVGFRRAHTTVAFHRANTRLIVRGPFRLSRNPVYLAGALFHSGLSLLANALWPLILLVPALIVVNALIVREEGYLTRRFGAEYEVYRKRVRRWL
jgi:protein-S-isoprenylcysteine O-methyltransferase Ste14